MNPQTYVEGYRERLAGLRFLTLLRTAAGRRATEADPHVVIEEHGIDATARDDSTRLRWAVYGGLAVLALALRLACATGLVGSDDLYYAKYARAIAEGEYRTVLSQLRGVEHTHYALRYGVLIPLAAIYKVFGVSEWSTVALPLIASTLSVVLLAAIGWRMFNLRVGIIAGLLYATFPVQLQFATVLEPEPVAECFALLGVLTYLYARRGGRAWLWLVAGFLLGSAYLAKEAAAFIGAAFFLHAAWERHWRGASLLALGMASVLTAEHAYYYVVWNDLLLRPHSTQLYTLRETDSFFPARLALKYRLFFKYPEAMLVPDLRMGLHSLACLIWAGTALMLKRRHGYMMIVLWATIPWLYLNFGSWSFTHSAPLPRAPRYIEFTYPPLMLLSGVALGRAFLARRAVAWPAAAAFVLVLVFGLFSGLAVRGTIARANEMTVLREIVRGAQRTHNQAIFTEDRRWRRALDVFDASLVSGSADHATIVLKRDAVGLPAIQSARPVPGSSGGRR